jgi:hypothetical protein
MRIPHSPFSLMKLVSSHIPTQQALSVSGEETR